MKKTCSLLFSALLLSFFCGCACCHDAKCPPKGEAPCVAQDAKEACPAPKCAKKKAKDDAKASAPAKKAKKAKKAVPEDK